MKKLPTCARGQIRVAWMVLWLLLASHALAGPVMAIELTREEGEFLQAKGSILFISQSNYPPFEFTDAADRRREGMMLDVVRWLAIELGFQPLFVDAPFLEAQETVLAGKADVLTSLFRSEQRAKRFAFTQPLFEVPASIFIHASRTDISGLRDLNGKTVAMQRGDFAKEFLASKGIQCTILATEDFSEAVDRVIAGQADAVIGDQQIVLYHLAAFRLADQMRKIGEPLYTGLNCMAVRPDNALLIGILNKGIAQAQATGALDKISRKWLGPAYVPRGSFVERHARAIAIAAAGLFGAALLAWLWNLQLRSKVQAATVTIARREQALRENEQNFRAFFDSMADLVLVGDLQGRILHCNTAAVRKTGYGENELRAMSFLDLHPPHLHGEAQTIITAMAHGKAETCPLPLQAKSGALLPVETRIWHGQWSGAACLFGISKDLSREQEVLQMFNRLFTCNPAPLALTDAATHCFVEINDAFTRLIGYSREEIVGRTSRDLHLVLEPDKHDQLALDLVALGQLKDIELRVRCRDGRLRDGLFFGELIENQGKQFLLTMMLDHTERKMAERLLHASELQFRHLFETMLDIYWKIDREGRILMISPSVTRITGYRPEEVLGTDMRSYGFNPKDSYFILAMMAKHDVAEHVELAVRAKDGSRLWFSCNVRINKDEQGGVVCIDGIARDVTATKKTALALQQELAFRTTIIANVADGLCVCCEIPEYPYVHFTVWNARMTDMTGYTMEAINTSGWCQTLFPDERKQQEALQRMRTLRQGRNLRNDEWEITRADGERRILSISTSFVASDQGRPHFLAVLRDMTKQKQGEEERSRLDKELQEARKQESLGRMAGATAHHLNNILSVMQGYLDLLQETLIGPPEAFIYLDKAVQATNRAAEFGHFMLRYGGQGVPEERELEVTEAVRQAMPRIKTTLPAHVRLETRFVSGLPPVRIAPDDLHRILTNLTANSAEAIDTTGGLIRITTGSAWCDKEVANGGIGTAVPQPGHYVFLEVSDTGCGIDQEALAQIFDPFFSTKFFGRGLGLASVSAIVRSWKGGLLVDTQPERGTTVRILLPTAESTPGRSSTWLT